MGSLSNYGENAFINHLCGTAYSPAATIYLALCTSDPGEAATGASMNEVGNSNGYARKAITFGAAASRAITQNATVTFDQATGAWGTVSHWAIVDSGTYGSGNVLAYGAFSSSISVVSGNTLAVASGQVSVSVDASSGAGFTTYYVNKWLDLAFRNQAYSQPSTYVALLDSDGADSDTTLTTAGKEVGGTSYARVLVNKAGGASPAWNTVSGGATTNANAITFPTVGSGGWGTIVGMALVDSGTLNSGNVLAYDNSNITDQSTSSGDTITFGSGQLAVSIT